MSIKNVSNKKDSNEISKDSNQSVPVGVFIYKGRTAILEKSSMQGGSFFYSWSKDNEYFIKDLKKVVFNNGLKNHKTNECSNFRFSYFGNRILVVYTRFVNSKKYTVIAESKKNIYEWEVISENLSDGFESVIVPDLKINKDYIMYEGGAFVRCLNSKDLEKWNDNNSLLFTSREGKFDSGNMRLLGNVATKRGNMLLYDAKDTSEWDKGGDEKINKESKEENNRKNVNKNGEYSLCLGGVLFDSADPRKILRRVKNPLWKSDIKFSIDSDCRPLGIISNKNSVHIFWADEDNEIIVVYINDFSSITRIFFPEGPELKKHSKNPIIKPQHSKYFWKNSAIFNPAALYDNDKVHLLYRAVGSDGISRIGYDSSINGIDFDGDHTHPVFIMENPRNGFSNIQKRYDPVMYASGGSWGGAEDPRMVKIDGRVFVTFNAFDGWDYIRVCVISIDEKDFKKKKWNWSTPLLISAPGQINKNWVLFPEKINGKFAILHSITPNIQIDFVEHLEDLALGKKIIDSKFVNKKAREEWDTWVRGAGPPPIKTEKGWLLLYHAINEEEPSQYKIGAMLLDLKNPEKVIARSKTPILSPSEWYENDWKPGVVYACGAIIKDEKLFVYYGGGDKHVCVATISVKELLEKLIDN